LAAAARIDRAHEVCGRLLGRPQLNPALRARALSLLGGAAMLSGRPDEAEQLYADAVKAAARAGCDVEVEILVEAALSCHVSAPVATSVAMISHALEILPRDAPLRRVLGCLDAYSRLIAGDPSGIELLVGEIARWSIRTSRDEGWGWTMAVHALNTFKLIEDSAAATELFEREMSMAIEGAPVSLWLDVIEARRQLVAGDAAGASPTMLHAAWIARIAGWRHPVIVPWALPPDGSTGPSSWQETSHASPRYFAAAGLRRRWC